MTEKTETPETPQNPSSSSDTIVFAGGCFWGTEHYLKQIHGVTSTAVGYANSAVPSPTYKEVCTGRTGAAEAVEVAYDPREIDLAFLVRLYLNSIDPTSLNRQGNDVGTQYRTGVYYTSPAQKPAILGELRRVESLTDKPVVVEVLPLENFYPAEEYHQDYLDKNPGGYCHLPAALFAEAARQRRYRRPDDDSLRRALTPLQWEVTQNAATEPPFRNQYNAERRSGLYVDVTTGQPLFASSAKFDSRCGWPAFSAPVDGDALDYRADSTHGMERIEVRSSQGDAHLGHVFPDGPRDKGGLRYCINSASLRFVPLADMEREGYGRYIPLVEKAEKADQ